MWTAEVVYGCREAGQMRSNMEGTAHERDISCGACLMRLSSGISAINAAVRGLSVRVNPLQNLLSGHLGPRQQKF